jgi:hypothetical protein
VARAIRAGRARNRGAAAMRGAGGQGEGARMS